MADIPQNSSYDTADPSAGFQNVFKSVMKRNEQDIASGALAPTTSPSPKSVDTSQWSGLGQQVQSSASTPPTAGSYNPAQEPSELKAIGPVTTPYGGKTKFEGFHPGVDVAGPMGTPIKAFVPGTVTAVRNGQRQGGPDYGNYVIVTDAQGDQHRYSHLLGAYVKVGQKVNQGEQLGALGNSGQTYSTHGGTGAHLDYRIKDAYGKYINPFRFLS